MELKKLSAVEIYFGGGRILERGENSQRKIVSRNTIQAKVVSNPKYSLLVKIIWRETYTVEEKLKKNYEKGQINAGLVG